MPNRTVKIYVKTWPVAGVFKISRGALTEIDTVIVEITQDGLTGRGECRPYSRYGETPQGVMDEISGLIPELRSGLSRQVLQTRLPAGAARNALDCALWDLESRLSRRPVWDLLSVAEPHPRKTAYTLSIDAPDKMILAARAAKPYRLLKIKIGGQDHIDTCLDILNARPDAHLIIDANESLSQSDLPEILKRLDHPRIALIEQPIPAGSDDSLGIDAAQCRPVCADESVHGIDDLERLWAAGYRAVNVKLDKTGGLTAAVQLMAAARERGFIVMAGCMAASSLAMAPMMQIECLADFIDLDGPLLLAEDIENGLIYVDATVYPPLSTLWGYQEPASSV